MDRDEASYALFRDNDQLHGKGLLIADESFQYFPSPSHIDLCVMTNRYDVAAFFKKQVESVNFSDFDVSSYSPSSFDYILLRLPKSKVLSHYLLQAVHYLLKNNAYLVMTGNNQEGIKNIIKESSTWIGELVSLELLGKGLRYAKIKKESEFTGDLQKSPYFESYHIDNGRYPLYSKAGIYSAQKIDQGSLFLIDALKKEAVDIKNPVLDLGCGNGFLSMMLAIQYDIERLIATDNNFTALKACEQNLQGYNIKAEVLADDCASTLPDRSIATIICNPPFHQGFATSMQLTEKFISTTKRLLKRKGNAYYVVNRFIAIEAVCRDAGLRFQLLSENGQFKVLHLHH